MVRTGILVLTAVLLAGCSGSPERGDGRGAVASSNSLPAPRTQAAAQCLSGLNLMGASYAELPDRELGDGCSNRNTVRLSSVLADSENLTVTNLGPVTCEVSQAFAGWARYGVDRAARQILGSGLRTIETFGSYSCRNVAGSGRRSGHATGAAIDVSGFVLDDGRRITIKHGWNGGTAQEREFLRVVQNSACKRFATVLGPEYNAAHQDHLHVEGLIGSGSYCR